MFPVNESTPPLATVREDVGKVLTPPRSFKVSELTENAPGTSRLAEALILLPATRPLLIFVPVLSGRKMLVPVSAVAKDAPKPVELVSTKAQGMMALLVVFEVPVPPMKE